MSDSKEQQPRYGFVVLTGRHKILDYHKPDGQQIATADNEDAARTIVRALNSHEALVKALRDLGEYAAALEMMANQETEGEQLVAARAALALAEKES